MIIRTIAVFALLLALFTGCESGKKMESLFFPVDSLLDGQVKALTRRKASLTKNVSMKGQTSTISYAPEDTTGWQKELEIFFHLNAVNKPVNKGLYVVSDSLDVGSNLKARSVHASEEAIGEKQVTIRYLKIYYDKTLTRPSRITAEVSEDNAMFEGTRKLEMRFDELDGENILSGYSIRGGQEMFLADSVQFDITGEIKL